MTDAESRSRLRIARVQEALTERELDALLVLSAPDVYYLTGFFYNPTERPAGIIVPQSGDPTLFLPLLDIDQEREECWIRHLETYPEYPGLRHPMTWLGGLLDHMGFRRATLGHAEGQISVTHMRLLREALPAAAFREAGEILGHLRLIKDNEEISLIRTAAKYADITQEIGMEALAAHRAATEFDLLNLILAGTSARMAKELPEIVNVRGVVGGAVVSGPRTAFPHGTTKQRRLRSGEPVMLSFGCSVGGYRAENTRTYFLGEPDPEAAALYRIVQETQEFGRELLGPGRACAEINRACFTRLREAGQEHRIRHRVGHGIGLEGHEPPWLEDGDPTALEPDMVVSMEPGLYDPAIGGFLIADTMLVTATGAEALSSSPRSIAEVVLPG